MLTADADALRDLTIKALEDVKGTEIKVLNVSELTTLTDYMVICTATSSRQLQALAKNVVSEARAEGMRPYNRNFEKANDWALIDFGDVIVHIMLEEARSYYALEKLWSDSDQPPEKTLS